VKPSVCVFHDALKINLAQAENLHKLEVDDGNFLVTFSSHNNGAQPPDHRLLTLHAVCARVAYLSGAAQAIFDELWQDVDDEQDIEETNFEHLTPPFATVPGGLQPLSLWSFGVSRSLYIWLYDVCGLWPTYVHQ